jgi:cephalosporin-C deacetylase-like acetyl esterase
MRAREQAAVIAILAAVVVSAVFVAAASSGVTKRRAASAGLFDYDRSAPLGLALGPSIAWQGVRRQDLIFNGAGTAHFKAYFVHPESGGPWPLVIWSPGSGGNRAQQLPDALAAARSGLASLLVDTPAFSNCRDAQVDFDAYVGYVISRRRAVDVAEILPNVDRKHIGAAGFSLGAEVTGSLAGVEHRIVAFALKSGRGHLTGFGRIICRSLGTQLDAYLAKLAVVDPVHWVRRATHAAFLVQNGTQDALTPRADVLALYAAAKGTKQLRWYPASHDLDAAAAADRLQWLLRHLRTH